MSGGVSIGHRLLLPRSGRSQRVGRWTPLSCGTRGPMRNENFGRRGALGLVRRRCAGGSGAVGAVWRPVAWSASGGNLPGRGYRVSDHRTITTYLIDKDDVLLHEHQPIPAPHTSIQTLEENGLRPLVITT